MKIVNLRDNNFGHQVYSSRFGTSDLFKWDRTCSQQGATVYTDMYLNDNLKIISGEKIAYLLEPISIHPHIYQWIVRNYTLFKEVWTHDDEVLRLLPNAKFVPTGGAWVDSHEQKLWDKTDLVSFLASNKNYTVGHKLRQYIRTILPASIPQFGKGFREINSKLEALQKFNYSITIENIKRDTYFSEKVIDCFLTGCVPIYWGTNKINDYFNGNGIIHFNSPEELMEILKQLSSEDYNKRIDAIKHNFEEAKKYIIPENWGIKNVNR